MPIARHLLIRGRVQGVFYRGWAVETARALARQGPPAARVERVEPVAIDPEAGLSGFTQYPTA